MRHHLIVILLLFSACNMYAWKSWPLPMDEADTQADTLFYGASLNGIFADTTTVFWLNSNTAGDVAQAQSNGILSLYAFKPATRNHRWWDYSYGIKINGRIAGPESTLYGQKATAYFQQLYAHCRLYIFDITAGIKPLCTTFGNQQLSIGSLLFSNNAHPLPRITIGIDRWTAFPFLFGYVEIRGGISHLWATTYNKDLTNPATTSDYFIHHKFLGARIGGKLPVRIIYEFHHAAQWGGKSPTYGDLGNDLNTFKNIFLARAGGSAAIETNNKQGNHLCMQQLALELNFDALHISAYWQALQEDNPIRVIGTAMNRADGLWGINISQFYLPYFQTVTYEFLNTTEQSGPLHDVDGFIFGGRDNYYGHAIYTQGWTYLGRTIGNPLLSPTNNRVRAHHVAINGDIHTFQYRFLCTHARYYKPYSEILSYNASKQPAYNQTSLLLEVEKKIPQAWGITFAAAIAADFYNNHTYSIGGKISMSKTFNYDFKK